VAAREAIFPNPHTSIPFLKKISALPEALFQGVWPIFAEAEPKFFAIHLQPRAIRGTSFPSMSIITVQCEGKCRIEKPLDRREV
jgi:hypothetical protein